MEVQILSSAPVTDFLSISLAAFVVAALMIAMRCLRHPDAFPRGDLIVQRALELGLARDEDWASSRAYLAHCLWRDHAVTLSKLKRKAQA